MRRREIFCPPYLIINHFQAARKAAGLDDSDDGGDIFTEGHDEDLLF